jgi:hypothetical protein
MERLMAHADDPNEKELHQWRDVMCRQSADAGEDK